MSASPVPKGYPRVSPYLIVDNAAATTACMVDVLGGSESRCTTTPGGDIMHAEVRIGDSVVMVGGANPEWPAVPAAVHVYVDDVDATYARALEAGVTSISEPATQPYGDRSAYVKDTSGTMWFLSTHIEDVSDEEIARWMSAR